MAESTSTVAIGPLSRYTKLIPVQWGLMLRPPVCVGLEGYTGACCGLVFAALWRCDAEHGPQSAVLHLGSEVTSRSVHNTGGSGARPSYPDHSSDSDGRHAALSGVHTPAPTTESDSSDLPRRHAPAGAKGSRRQLLLLMHRFPLRLHRQFSLRQPRRPVTQQSIWHLFPLSCMSL